MCVVGDEVVGKEVGGDAREAGDEVVGGVEEVSDEELAALAMAADPGVEPDENAVPLRDSSDHDAVHLLPSWYMPVPTAGLGQFTGWRRRVVITVIAAFVLINAYGLCSTYGIVGFG
jgi:hypothetical protein